MRKRLLSYKKPHWYKCISIFSNFKALLHYWDIMMFISISWKLTTVFSISLIHVSLISPLEYLLLYENNFSLYLKALIISKPYRKFRYICVRFTYYSRILPILAKRFRDYKNFVPHPSFVSVQQAAALLVFIQLHVLSLYLPFPVKFSKRQDGE